jgi:hypothetical protein
LLNVIPDNPKEGFFRISEISSISDGIGLIRYSEVDSKRKIRTKESFEYCFGETFRKLLEKARGQ